MKDRCVTAVEGVLNRRITNAEANGIEDRITKNMRFAAQNDPAYASMTREQQLMEGAKRSALELMSDAADARAKIVMTIQAHDRINNGIAEAEARGMNGLEHFRRLLVAVADAKSNVISHEVNAQAIERNAIRTALDAFIAVEPRLLGLFEDKEGIALMVKAMHGEPTGNAKIDAGAKAWLATTEQLRLQFNQSGGKIGLLENWALPQHHDQMRVNQAGVDKWVRDVFDMLDRKKYVNDDGTKMSDGQVMTFLKEAWQTIATDGVNKIVPGQGNGGGAVSNDHAESRSIHYKDAQAYLDYQAAYGDKSLWGVMTGHIRKLSKSISLLETFGPNPDHTVSLITDQQLMKLTRADPSKADEFKEQAAYVKKLYEFSTGKSDSISNRLLAQSFDTLRNWLVTSRLGSAAITALADEGTMHMTALANGLPQVELVRNELATLNPLNKTEENQAHRAGLGLDTMLNHLNRWGQDNLGPTWSNKMAATVMRASGIEALDGGRRRAFGVTMMSGLGETVQNHATIAAIPADSRNILTSKGATETNFAVWKLAELEKWGAGNGVLTPEAIQRIPAATLDPVVKAEQASIAQEKQDKIDSINKAPMNAGQKQQAINLWSKTFDDQIAQVPDKIRRDAIMRLLGMTLEETNMAVMKPGVETQMMSRVAGGKGTWSGELYNSIFQFKSFPIAMFQKHIAQRGMGQETVGGKAAYIAGLMAMTTVFGALAQSVNDLVSGKDIRNYNPMSEFGGKNWIGAFLKGGSLGIYGDFLFSATTQHNDQGPMSALLGPTAGLIDDAYKLTAGNLYKAAEGKHTNFGTNLVSFIKGNTPGASLWYVKGALDHLIVHNLQEAARPGYLSTMQQRARKEFGQSYWWSPGKGPEGMRAPGVAR